MSCNQLPCALELKQNSILKYPLVAHTDLWRHPKHRPCSEALGEVGKDHSPSLTGYSRRKQKTVATAWQVDYYGWNIPFHI